MFFNELAQRVHQNAISKGWWDEERNFGETIALMHEELSEALSEYRHGRSYTEIYSTTELNGIQKPEGIPVELCDTIIRILDFLGSLDIDIDSVMASKIAYNETRPYRHGGLKA